MAVCVCRLWYHVEGVGCPSGQPSSTAPALVCRTFLPKADERFDQLVHRVNKRLESDRLGGECDRLGGECDRLGGECDRLRGECD